MTGQARKITKRSERRNETLASCYALRLKTGKKNNSQINLPTVANCKPIGISLTVTPQG